MFIIIPDVFLSLCLALMLASLLETIIITNLMCGAAHSPVPSWISVLVLHILGRLVLLPPKPRDEDDTVIQNPDTQGRVHKNYSSTRVHFALQRSVCHHLLLCLLCNRNETLLFSVRGQRDVRAEGTTK